MNTLRDRKLRKVFASFDPDQDEVITQQDLEGIADVWCRVYAIPEGSDGWDSLHAMARHWWSGMAEVLGQPELTSLTLQQWLQAAEEPLFEGFVDRAAIPFSMAVFDIADSDGDGQITAEQMMAAQSKTGMAPEETQRVFGLLDADGDGLVTAADYVRASREFYFSEDERDPGNYIAGSLD